MTVYLSSPSNPMQASLLANMPVLISFGEWAPAVADYAPSFSRILMDSGAYSELRKGGKKIDVAAYRDFCEPWRDRADAIAGLDDIRGDWKRSVRNYQEIPWSFPTFHPDDPSELLDDLIPLARERRGWLGIGGMVLCETKENFMRHTLDRIPEDLHVHVFAGRGLLHFARINSTDSTDWWRTSIKLRTLSELKHLTPAECLEIVIKRYQRWQIKPAWNSPQSQLFD